MLVAERCGRLSQSHKQSGQTVYVISQSYSEYMSSIRIQYNKVVMPFPRNSELDVSELTALFKAKELGIHIKVLQDGTCHNQYSESFS